MSNQANLLPLLLVDDDPVVLRSMESALRPWASAKSQEIMIMTHPQAAFEFLKSRRAALVILDLLFGRNYEGMDWLARLRNQDPQLPIIVVTAHGELEFAIRAMKLGATDFIVKPWVNERLLDAIKVALDSASRRKDQSESSRDPVDQNHLSSATEEIALIGNSLPMVQLRAQIDRIAPTSTAVLITGETGSGKKLVSRILHRQSLRGHRDMVCVDALSLNDPGIEAAIRSTVFLEEIGTLSPAQQSRLFALVESRLDVRWISSTRIPMQRLSDPGLFHPQLLEQMASVKLTIPPLRERNDDIPDLVRFFAAQFRTRYQRPSLRASETTLLKLQRHSWPGNVEELRRATERAVITSIAGELIFDDQQLTGQTYTIQEESPTMETLNLDQLEKRAIQTCLSKHGWNISLAAKELGLTRASLYRRIERHGL